MITWRRKALSLALAANAGDPRVVLNLGATEDGVPTHTLERRFVEGSDTLVADAITHAANSRPLDVAHHRPRFDMLVWFPSSRADDLDYFEGPRTSDALASLSYMRPGAELWVFFKEEKEEPNDRPAERLENEARDAANRVGIFPQYTMDGIPSCARELIEAAGEMACSVHKFGDFFAVVSSVCPIAPGLRPLRWPIDGLANDDANERTHSDRNIGAIEFSLHEFGQRKPVVVNRIGNIIEAGHGLVRAARAQGWTEIAVLFVEDDAATHAAFRIADNRTAELAAWDAELLDATLTSLSDIGYDLGGLGWEPCELEALTLDPEDDLPEPSSEPDTDSQKERLSFSATQWAEIALAVELYRTTIADLSSTEDIIAAIARAWRATEVN